MSLYYPVFDVFIVDEEVHYIVSRQSRDSLGSLKYHALVYSNLFLSKKLHKPRKEEEEQKYYNISLA